MEDVSALAPFSEAARPGHDARAEAAHASRLAGERDLRRELVVDREPRRLPQALTRR